MVIAAVGKSVFPPSRCFSSLSGDLLCGNGPLTQGQQIMGGRNVTHLALGSSSV